MATTELLLSYYLRYMLQKTVQCEITVVLHLVSVVFALCVRE
jgi:hypothetical protein